MNAFGQLFYSYFYNELHLSLQRISQALLSKAITRSITNVYWLGNVGEAGAQTNMGILMVSFAQE